MSNELATYSILALVTVVAVLAFWIGVTLQGIHNTVAIIAPAILHELEQIVINLAMIIRQNSMVTAIAEQAKMAKVPLTYKPKRKV